jgi:hypothetical protein
LEIDYGIRPVYGYYIGNIRAARTETKDTTVEPAIANVARYRQILSRYRQIVSSLN